MCSPPTRTSGVTKNRGTIAYLPGSECEIELIVLALLDVRVQRKKSCPFFSFTKRRTHHLAVPQNITSDGVPSLGPVHANAQFTSCYHLTVPLVHTRTSASHTRSATEIAILTASVSTGLERKKIQSGRCALLHAKVASRFGPRRSRFNLSPTLSDPHTRPARDTDNTGVRHTVSSQATDLTMSVPASAYWIG